MEHWRYSIRATDAIQTTPGQWPATSAPRITRLPRPGDGRQFWRSPAAAPCSDTQGGGRRGPYKIERLLIEREVT